MREEERKRREAKYDDGECTQEHICGWTAMNKTEVDSIPIAKLKSDTKYG